MPGYRLLNGDRLLRLDDGVTIPVDERNGDYRAYTAWRDAGGVPDPLSRADIAGESLRLVREWCDAAHASFTAYYPQAEIDSWSRQLAEAQSYAANPTSATPYLSGLSSARGVPLVDVVARVLAKASAYSALSSALVGRRQRAEDQIQALLSDPRDDAVVIPLIEAVEP